LNVRTSIVKGMMVVLALPALVNAQSYPSKEAALRGSEMRPELYMVAPVVDPASLPKACVLATRLVLAPGTPAITNRDEAALRNWGKLHFKFEGGCTDWAFVASKWQEAIGSPVTGVLTAGDVATIGRQVRENGAKQREADQAEAKKQAHARSQAQLNATNEIWRKAAQRPRAPGAPGMLEQANGNAKRDQQTYDENRQRLEIERQERERNEAEFIRRQNEQIRRQQEQWAEEERRRAQQPN